jgi:predicted hydrocarbon binding protein
VLKAAAQAHWEHLRMGEKVAPYAGNLDGFLAFLRSSWGWKIEHDRAAGVILVDEAKDYCVCPLVEKGRPTDLTQLCDCSEGFAERLFGAVVGRPVRAEVTQSVLRGASSCHYRITLT